MHPARLPEINCLIKCGQLSSRALLPTGATQNHHHIDTERE
jgi:hypothetical protein